MEKETLIEQYLKTITGQEYDVEIIDGVVDIIKEGCWHIYVMEDRVMFIGAFVNDDIDYSNIIKSHQYQIRDILNRDETV